MINLGTLVGTWYSDEAGLNPIRSFTLPYNPENITLSLTGSEIFSNYLRYTFTNDSGEDQEQFLIKTNFSNVPLSGQLLQLDQFVPTNVLATLARSILTGISAEGVYGNVGINDVGALNTSDFILDVVRGKYPSYSYNVKFGRNSDIDIGSSPEDVWNGGGLYTGFNATAAETVTVVSANNTDRPASTGAHTIELIGLDSDYNRQTEILTLNGTSAVTSVNNYIRLNRVKILTAGTGGQNAGEITVRQSTTTANIFAVMPQGTNQTAICADTVPAGKTRYILNLNAEMSRANGSAGSANVRFLVRELGGVFRALKNSEVTNSLPYNPQRMGALEVPEKSDVKWQIASVSDNNTVVTAEFEYIDIDN